CRRACWKIFSCNSGELVAATTRKTSARPDDKNERWFPAIWPALAASRMPVLTSGAMTQTAPPQRSRPCILASAIAPPPTTRHRRPPSFRNNGNSSSITIANAPKNKKTHQPVILAVGLARLVYSYQKPAPPPRQRQTTTSAPERSTSLLAARRHAHIVGSPDAESQPPLEHSG